MSTSCNSETTVNTFITTTAVIKFSGGSVGTDEWTDSDDEERPTDTGTAYSLPALQGRSGDGARLCEITERLPEGPPVASQLKTNGQMLMNGNVCHQENKNGHPDIDWGGSGKCSTEQCTPEYVSGLPVAGHHNYKEVPSCMHTTSATGMTTLDQPQVIHGLNRLKKPSTGVSLENHSNTARHSSGPVTGRPYCSTVGTKESSPEDRSISCETELDISLPSEDQDLALITYQDLGISENHFSQPEGVFGFSKLEELEAAIEHCKEAVKSTKEHSEDRRKLVAKLVQLRLQLLKVKEGEEGEGNPEVKVVLGHHFRCMSGKSLNDHCEVCVSVIWALLQTWYKCAECSFRCHGKCLNLVKRQCVSSKVSNFDLSICPERGLSSQNYRCAECRAPLAFTGSVQSEPRLCDYRGVYYCHICHWNDVEVIPARVIHNWDFEPRKVCRESKQLLQRIRNRAVLRIQDLNPMLFSYVEELSQIKKLREEVLIMKVYFLSCRRAMQSKILRQLQNRPHFVENSDMYSLQDLIDIEEGSLLSELATIHGDYAVHIRIDCQLCQARGFICEMCNLEEVLYPFDLIATVCAKCSAVYHRDCYYKRSGECPKCLRMSQRSSLDRPPASPPRPIYK